MHDVLERLDLAGFADRQLGTLSGGERQRVFLARALAQGAPLLLLDEPTTALDIGHQQEVLELVDQLRREHGLTVLATMHDLSLAGEYADRLVLLADGRVVAAGSPPRGAHRGAAGRALPGPGDGGRRRPRPPDRSGTSLAGGGSRLGQLGPVLGFDLMIENLAPCGSASMANRPAGESVDGTGTEPPNRVAVAAVASTSSTSK